MSFLIVLASLCFLMFIAYRGYSVILFAPVAALLAVLLQGPALIPPMFAGVYMEKLVGFLKPYFPVFLLGALFGKLMDDSGSVTAIAPIGSEVASPDAPPITVRKPVVYFHLDAGAAPVALSTTSLSADVDGEAPPIALAVEELETRKAGAEPAGKGASYPDVIQILAGLCRACATERSDNQPDRDPRRKSTHCSPNSLSNLPLDLPMNNCNRPNEKPPPSRAAVRARALRRSESPAPKSTARCTTGAARRPRRRPPRNTCRWTSTGTARRTSSSCIPTTRRARAAASGSRTAPASRPARRNARHGSGRSGKGAKRCPRACRSLRRRRPG